jgi:hypothetical protein
MANTSRNISRACGKTSDEADVMHRAASRHDRVLCGALGCRPVSIGYLKSRCSASGCNVERDEQV